MIYRGTQQQIDEYFNPTSDTGYVSQSQLKLFAKGIDYLNAAKDKESTKKLYFEEPGEHFIVGSAADCLLTRPDDFENLYHVSTLVSKPSDSIISIVKKVYDEKMLTYNPEDNDSLYPAVHVGSLLDNREKIIESARLHGYQARWGDDAVFKAINEGASDYWQEIVEANGRQVLTLEDYTVASRINESIREMNPFGIFNDENWEAYSFDLVFQWPFYNDINMTKLLPDIVIVDHGAATIKVIDIKTMSDSTVDFIKSFRRFGYDFQAAFYANHFINKIKTDGYYLPFNSKKIGSIYKVEFYFIVESTTYPGNPLLYKMDKDYLTSLFYDRKTQYFTGVNAAGEVVVNIIPKRKGIANLIHDYYDYTVNGEYKAFLTDEIIITEHGIKEFIE